MSSKIFLKLILICLLEQRSKFGFQIMCVSRHRIKKISLFLENPISQYSYQKNNTGQ